MRTTWTWAALRLSPDQRAAAALARQLSDVAVVLAAQLGTPAYDVVKGAMRTMLAIRKELS